MLIRFTELYFNGASSVPTELSQLTAQIEQCMSLETTYTARIMSGPQTYLAQASQTISTVEQGAFCSSISNATLTTD